ncbi:hypothetical protein NQD34_006621 [Periophthalmus magnuspinnatus]|nr:hypothetical protein NQD34_006621 [Periophthalmus magnuspinnatus]
MSKPRNKQKTLIITDEEEEEVLKEEEQNPFSFKQFLRSKNQNQDQDQDSEDPSQEEEEEGAWGCVWPSGGRIRSGSEEEEVTRFDSFPGGDGDGDDGEDSRQSYEGDDETSILDPKSRTRPRTRTGLQQVKHENEQLKKTIRDLREQSLRDQTRAEELRAELLQWRMRDQQEAQDLETMVQSVEHNLRVMTKRALKAESSVSKLKSEMKQLQTQLEEVQAENSVLRASESELVLTMRHNAATASERLQETAAHAQSSVRRLLSEAESLMFVSELLQSIDRMSSV